MTIARWEAMKLYRACAQVDTDHWSVIGYFSLVSNARNECGYFSEAGGKRKVIFGNGMLLALTRCQRSSAPGSYTRGDNNQFCKTLIGRARAYSAVKIKRAYVVFNGHTRYAFTVSVGYAQTYRFIFDS